MSGSPANQPVKSLTPCTLAGGPTGERLPRAVMPSLQAPAANSPHSRGILAISQWTNSTRGRSAGTLRPAWFTSSPRLGTSLSMQVSTNERVPPGASFHARCGLRLSDSANGAAALPNANSLGMAWPSAKLSLRSCMMCSPGETDGEEPEPIPSDSPGRSYTSSTRTRCGGMMSELEDLTTLVRAATPLLVIETVDEQRVIECFRHVIARALRPLWRWTLTDGLSRLDFAQTDGAVAPDATATLHAIRAQGEPGIYLMFDFHPLLGYAMSLRQLREIVQRQRSAAHTIVLVGARVELPAELEALALRVPLSLPDIKELAGILRGEAAGWQREQGRRIEVDNEAARTIVRNLLGLSAPDARRIVRKLIYADGALGPGDLPVLMQSKFDLLNRSGLLHYEYATASFADIAGVGRVREWVQRRRAVFLSPADATPMLDPPKGVLLLGVQGCGKSLAAKAIAGGFGVPLVRLDFGTLYNKYQGETEKNLREALGSTEL